MQSEMPEIFDFREAKSSSPRRPILPKMLAKGSSIIEDAKLLSPWRPSIMLCGKGGEKRC